MSRREVASLSFIRPSLTRKAEPASAIRLVTLGSPRLDLSAPDALSRRTIGPGKPLALLTFLAFAPQRRATRDTLCDLLWGDRALDHARPSLRQTLWLIKTQIHPDIVTADAAGVALPEVIPSDAHEFNTAIEANDLERAIELYSGDFFTGYGAPGAGRFEEWASLERARFRSLFTNAAEVLARQSLDSGRFADTVALARRLRTVDPHGQIGWRMLLEARTASGDNIGALAAAEHFSEWLRQEEWDPEPASLVALYAARHVAEPTGPDAAAGPMVAELVGREREFAAIHHAWTIAQTKGARIVRIVGDSGLGKTRLTRDIAARIRSGRGRARYARANYGERNIPFSFAAAAAEMLAAVGGAGGVAPGAAQTLVALNPALSSQYSQSVSAPERLEPLRVGLALLELISSVADEQPIAIVLDDMHWCDEASRAALIVVTSRLKRQNVLLVLTTRPIYAADSLPSDSLEFRLTRLTADQIGGLITSLARLPETPWAHTLPERVCSATKGNPLYVLDALRLCMDSMLLERNDDEWFTADPVALLEFFEKKATVSGRLSALSATKRSVLLTLGIAGLPVARDIAATAAVADSESANAAAAELEIRGLLIVANDTWSLAHDSIRESLIGETDTITLKNAQARLGEAMAASTDAHWQRKAILHLAEGGLWERVAESAIPLLRRSTSHSNEVDAQLSSLLGSAAKTETLAKVKHRLPFSVRRPEIIRRGLAFGAVAAVGLALFALSEIPIAGDESGTVAVLEDTGGGFSIRNATLDLDGWDAMSPLRPGSAHRVRSPGSSVATHATGQPGSDWWAAYSTFPDSGQGDIVMISQDGARVRLTKSPGDDRPISFSPDGSQLLYLTTRWSRTGWSDVAALNMKTMSTRRLTHGSASYQFPRWSPDGTRIAFTRNRPGGDESSVCIIDASGAGMRCPSHTVWRFRDQAGWLDAHRLLILADSGGALKWLALDADRGTTSRTGFDTEHTVTLDQTGGWALMESRRIGDRFVKVSPAGRADLARAVALDPGVPAAVWFASKSVAPNVLDSIAILRSPGPLTPDVPHQLRPTGWTRDRRPVSPAVARWRSLTPAIAAIDSIGILIARDTGNAIVELSAGGWRTTRDTIPIRAGQTKTLLDEKWEGDVLKQWRLFGSPLPALMRIGGRRFFYNNGDGTYFSGAYLRDGLDASRGIAMDFDLVTPVNRNQWQIVLAGLPSVTRPKELARWDHRTGYVSDYMSRDLDCWFAYPEGEGATARLPIWLLSLRSAISDFSYRIDMGVPNRVRIQLFSDGRCGIAINGHALRIAQSTRPAGGSVHPAFQGNSVGTRMLVGAVVLRSGTPPDIDWTRLEFDGHYWAPRPTRRTTAAIKPALNAIASNPDRH